MGMRWLSFIAKYTRINYNETIKRQRCEKMNYGEIKKNDIANGEGVRVSLFVSGCTHHCPGCFNAVTWDFEYGQEFTEETEDEVLEALAPAYISGLSLLGGEPFEPQNQRVLVGLLRKVKERYPKKTIWCYSGYLFDQDLKQESRARCEVTDEMLAIFGRLGGWQICRTSKGSYACVQGVIESANY